MRTFPASGRGQPCAQRRRAPAGFRGAGSPAAAAPEADRGAGEQDQEGKATQPAGGTECEVEKSKENSGENHLWITNLSDKLNFKSSICEICN